MFLEILLASVLGFLIYRYISWNKEETLALEDGWWGPGAKPTAREDESIRPFKVETSDEEIKVRPLFPGGLQRQVGASCCGPQPCWSWLRWRQGLRKRAFLGASSCLLFSHRVGAAPSPQPTCTFPLPKPSSAQEEGAASCTPVCTTGHRKQLHPPLPVPRDREQVPLGPRCRPCMQ
jgi:hypothetical protein